MATISGYILNTGELVVLDGFDATGVTVPTAHTTLTARNTADSHPISAITDLEDALDTHTNDIDELGDQVSGIEEKIPSGASAENQLATASDVADKISKTDTEEQTIISDLVFDGDLEVTGDTNFSTASPTSETVLSYAEADDKALLTKTQVAEVIATILPSYPTTDGTYTLKYTLTDGVGTLSWVSDT